MRTMVRISNRDNSPIPSRMLEHRGADRAGLAIAVWHRNCPDSRDRGPRPRPRPDLRRDRDRARTKEERRGRARAIRTLRHDPDCPPSMLSLFHRLARLTLDMVRSPYGVGCGGVWSARGDRSPARPARRGVDIFSVTLVFVWLRVFRGIGRYLCCDGPDVEKWHLTLTPSCCDMPICARD